MLNLVMLNVVMINVVRLNVGIHSVGILSVCLLKLVILSAVMLNVFMPKVAMPSVVMLSAVRLNVVAPRRVGDEEKQTVFRRFHRKSSLSTVARESNSRRSWAIFCGSRTNGSLSSSAVRGLEGGQN
jgi:hypothetical protein